MFKYYIQILSKTCLYIKFKGHEFRYSVQFFYTVQLSINLDDTCFNTM